MLVIKRTGEEVNFDASKIAVAISKANQQTQEEDRLSQSQIDSVVDRIVLHCTELGRAVSVEEIQDMVENQLMNMQAYGLARNYITYRYRRAEARRANTTDEKILSLINRRNEEANQENANKNPILNSTQRDYMAGEVSKDLTRRFMLPDRIWDAHEKGIIHFHKCFVA